MFTNSSFNLNRLIEKSTKRLNTRICPSYTSFGFHIHISREEQLLHFWLKSLRPSRGLSLFSNFGLTSCCITVKSYILKISTEFESKTFQLSPFTEIIKSCMYIVRQRFYLM